MEQQAFIWGRRGPTGLATARPPVLFVTNPLQASPSGGRALLSRQTHEALAQLAPSRLEVVELARHHPRGLRPVARALRGAIDGATPRGVRSVLDRLQASGAGTVVIDGSNLGNVAAAVKTERPGVRVIVLFHNVEARFFAGALRHRPTPRALAVLLANLAAERKSVRHGDELVCLSERDRHQLRRLYGRAGTRLCPLALRDAVPASPPPAPRREPYALFVGGSFYANRAGIEWFARKVAPRSPLPTVVVGRGFEGLRDRLEASGNVEVVGETEDLAPWYAGASVVVAPIFDGSGMKTKVAEALQFGKRIVGTPDAFAGYEAVAGAAGPTCRTATEFLQALEQAAADPPPAFDPRLRALYEEHYSPAAYRARWARILDVPA